MSQPRVQAPFVPGQREAADLVDDQHSSGNRSAGGSDPKSNSTTSISTSNPGKFISFFGNSGHGDESKGEQATKSTDSSTFELSFSFSFAFLNSYFRYCLPPSVITTFSMRIGLNVWELCLLFKGCRVQKARVLELLSCLLLFADFRVWGLPAWCSMHFGTLRFYQGERCGMKWRNVGGCFRNLPHLFVKFFHQLVILAAEFLPRVLVF